MGAYPDSGNWRQRKMRSRGIGIIEMRGKAGGSWNVPDNARFHKNRSSFAAPENWPRCLRCMMPFSGELLEISGLPIRLTPVSKTSPPAETSVPYCIPRAPVAADADKGEPSNCLTICLRPEKRVAGRLRARNTDDLEVFAGGPILGTIVSQLES